MTDRKHLTEQKAEKFLPTAKGNLNEAHARNLSLFIKPSRSKAWAVPSGIAWLSHTVSDRNYHIPLPVVLDGVT
jgi:hypothetical protein